MKKIYESPLMEVSQVHFGAALLDGSPAPVPPHPVPGRRGASPIE